MPVVTISHMCDRDNGKDIPLGAHLSGRNRCDASVRLQNVQSHRATSLGAAARSLHLSVGGPGTETAALMPTFVDRYEHRAGLGFGTRASSFTPQEAATEEGSGLCARSVCSRVGGGSQALSEMREDLG